jgi:hypothetical protein
MGTIERELGTKYIQQIDGIRNFPLPSHFDDCAGAPAQRVNDGLGYTRKNSFLVAGVG